MSFIGSSLNKLRFRRSGRAHDVISLPVLIPDHPQEYIQRRQTKTQRWRAFSLLMIHALIVVHLLHWYFQGTTVGRFVLSDSMETLELGRLNPGFLLFSTAMIVTMLSGRWLCGWGCHMGGLQDACAWLMRRIGIKPKLMRTRLLGYAPLMFGIYMFIWPTLRRDVLVPLFNRVWPQGVRLLGHWHPFPGLESHLVSDNLWNGLPGLAIAIPFLLICGGLTVYCLGARGFCRYGCPYGGMFSSVERLAPLRIRVDMNACDGCGKCTAACSSGIRVHEEVRAYGRVVSEGCIKTLDCVAVCPHDALTFGLTKPALIKGRANERKPRKVYDTTWGEEIYVIGLFLITFFTVRGLYALIPMLMAVGIGVCAAAGGWFVWRCVKQTDARMCGMQLKRSGRLTGIGLFHIVTIGLVWLLIIHSLNVRLMQWYGGIHDRQVLRTRDEVFRMNPVPLDPATSMYAKEALHWYNRSSSLVEGGIGLVNTPEIEIRRAWLELVLGNVEQAEYRLDRIANAPYGTDAHHADLARIALMRQDQVTAFNRLEAAIKDHPDYVTCRELLVWLYMQTGDIKSALLVYESRLRQAPEDAECRMRYGTALLRLGSFERARIELAAALEQRPRDVRGYHDLAHSYEGEGKIKEARAVLERAIYSVPLAKDSFEAHLQQISE